MIHLNYTTEVTCWHQCILVTDFTTMEHGFKVVLLSYCNKIYESTLHIQTLLPCLSSVKRDKGNKYAPNMRLICRYSVTDYSTIQTSGNE
jgi:hypothetical protein